MDRSINELKKLYSNSEICLLVGAGVSKSCGLPDWNALSVKVIQEAWPDRQRYDLFSGIERSTRARYSPLDAMRMARHKIGADFNSVVSKCLYATAASVSPLLESILLLRKVRRVICTNYDDLLEEAYTRLGIKCRPMVQGDDLPLDGDEVLIFHPHGFLPRRIYPRDFSKEPIVLSEDDYHELYSAPYSWPNVIQLNLLISFNVLSVGCSLKDPNLRRLLDIVKTVRTPTHFALMRNPNSQSKKANEPKPQQKQPRWWKELMSFEKHIEEENLKERGVTPIWYEEDSDVPKILAEIA
ncbi:MAG: SIR2 family protein [Pyrinomonadaceae bacterium]